MAKNSQIPFLASRLSNNKGREILLLASLAAIVIFLIAKGNFMSLGFTVLGIYALVFTIRWPMPLLFLGLLLAADIDYTLELNLPALLQLPGFQVTIKDVVLILIFTIGVLKLFKRGERPMFLGPLSLIGLAVGLSCLAGAIAGTFDISRTFNGLRPFEPYMLYFAACGIVNTQSRLRALVIFLYCCIFFAVPNLIWQVLSGTTTYSTEILISGVWVSYQKLALAHYVLIGACIAFAVLIIYGFEIRYILLIGLALSGIAIQFSRQWYLYILIGFSIVLLLGKGRGKVRGLIIILPLVLVFQFLLEVSNLLLVPQFGGALLDFIRARWVDLFDPVMSESGIGRIWTFQQMWEIFKTAPIFGLGPGQTFEAFNFYFNDVGFPNTLVRHGVFGFFAVLYLIISVFHKAGRLIKYLQDKRFHSYILGSLGAFGAIIIAYSFTNDYFTLYPTGTVLILILMEAVFRLHPLSIVPQNKKVQQIKSIIYDKH